MSIEQNVVNALSYGQTPFNKTNESIGDYLAEDRDMYQFKVILLGDVAVGKSCLLSRFVDNKFTDDYKCNVGVEFKVKTIYVDKTSGADLKIWDTAGEEKFRSLTKQYYRDAHGILLLFDLTSKDTFDNLGSWIDEIKTNATNNPIIYLVGNKSDLIAKRAVSKEDAQSFAESKKIKYQDVSAKNGSNVVLLFENLANQLVKKQKLLDEKEDEDFQVNKKTNNSSVKKSLNQSTGRNKINRLEAKTKEIERSKKVGCC